MDQLIKREDLKKRLAEKKAQQEELKKQLGQAENRELMLRQLKINLALEIRRVQGSIDTLEELLGVKKPGPEREEKKEKAEKK